MSHVNKLRLSSDRSHLNPIYASHLRKFERPSSRMSSCGLAAARKLEDSVVYVGSQYSSTAASNFNLGLGKNKLILVSNKFFTYCKNYHSSFP